MANRLYQQMNQNNQSSQIQSIRNLANTIRGQQNPNQALGMLAQNNPQIANIMNMLNGRSPKEVFFQQAQQMGINPNQIINSLR